MSDNCMNHIESYWKELTVSANKHFNNGDLEKALSGYKEALYRAEVMNNHIPDCLRLKIPFIQVYIISCNNLANTYQDMGQKDEAEKMLKRAVYYLLHIAGNEGLNMDEILSEMRRATVAYIHFMEGTDEGKTKVDLLFRILREHLLDEYHAKEQNPSMGSFQPYNPEL